MVKRLIIQLLYLQLYMRFGLNGNQFHWQICLNLSKLLCCSKKLW